MNARGIRRALIVSLGIIVLVVLAFLPVTVPTADVTGPPAPATDTTTDATSHLMGGISGGMMAIQQFPAASTDIQAVALLLGTYHRTNQGTARISMQANTNGAWQNLATQSVEKAKLQDNALYSFTFTPPLTVAKGQSVRIILESDGGANDAIGWWTNRGWKPDGYTLAFNGQEQEGTAAFQVTYAPATGRLFRMLGMVWNRMTVFLDPSWRFVLLIGLGLLGGGVILTGRALIAA
jgi:hypothetical protein